MLNIIVFLARYASSPSRAARAKSLCTLRQLGEALHVVFLELGGEVQLGHAARGVLLREVEARHRVETATIRQRKEIKTLLYHTGFCKTANICCVYQ